MLLIKKGDKFCEEGIDSGGVHNLPLGYTLESNKMKEGIIWGLTPGFVRFILHYD